MYTITILNVLIEGFEGYIIGDIQSKSQRSQLNSLSQWVGWLMNSAKLGAIQRYLTCTLCRELKRGPVPGANKGLTCRVA